MPHALVEIMRSRIASGLQRQSITTPSRWAEKYRIMGPPFAGKWSFKWHPWLREMHDSTSEINIGQKSSQMGFTELLLNLEFFNIDVKGVDCLHVLPSKTPDASEFSAGRFDGALEESPHLRSLFSDVQNVGHKRAGSANLYIRGSKSRGGLKSVPVGFIGMDELDEMKQAHVPLALERASGQLEWMAWLISTPTLPDFGINAYFQGSTQEKFCFKCPGCSRWTELVFPECLELIGEDPNDPRLQESYYKCSMCKIKLEHETKIDWLSDGKWIESYGQRERRGFHISRMYSMAASGKPSALGEFYLRGTKDPAVATEFYNSGLGLTYTVKGAQLTDEDLNNHVESYQNGKLRPTGLMTLGVDVGNELHCEVDEWQLGGTYGIDFNTDATCRIKWIGKLNHFDELDQLMRDWGIHACVIDANPERRAALQFANRFFGLVRLCIYSEGINGKDIRFSKDDENIVLVDRTSWMDLSLSRFKRDEMISIPVDTPFEYKQHLKCPIRVYKNDKNGNPIGYYENRGRADHFAHSRTYAEIALKFGANSRSNRDIRSPV